MRANPDRENLNKGTISSVFDNNKKTKRSFHGENTKENCDLNFTTHKLKLKLYRCNKFCQLTQMKLEWENPFSFICQLVRRSLSCTLCAKKKLKEGPFLQTDASHDGSSIDITEEWMGQLIMFIN